jgi:glycosyltransferase involved in cell wall biosynthesis
MSVLKNHISVIITKNEVHAIADCLRSVAWIDETVVLDSGATDETLNICEKMGAKATVTNDCSGYSIQKIVRLRLPRNLGCFRLMPMSE